MFVKVVEIFAGVVMSLAVIVLIIRDGLPFLKRLLGRTPRKPSTSAESFEHAVLLYIPLSDSGFGSPEEREAIRKFSDEFEEAITASNVGEFDGDEFGEGQCTLFMYGRNADALFDAIEPVLRAGCRAGSYAIKRYGNAGDPNAREVRVDF